MVILYTQPNCAPCLVAKNRLTKAGIPFELIDIRESPAAFDKIQAAGFNGTPVLEHDGKLTDIRGLLDIVKSYPR